MRKNSGLAQILICLVASGLSAMAVRAEDLTIGTHNAHRITSFPGNALCITALNESKNQLALLRSKRLSPGLASILGLADTKRTSALFKRYTREMKRKVKQKVPSLTRARFASVVLRCSSRPRLISQPPVVTTLPALPSPQSTLVATIAPTATATPTSTPTPTKTPTPTPGYVDKCLGDQFAIHWQVAGWPMVNFDTSIAPQIIRGKNVAMNSGDHQAAYPYNGENGTLVNGGIPQLADLNLHISRFAQGVVASIPDPHFNGYLMIDYEHWWPQWERTEESYKQLSRSYARSHSSNQDTQYIENLAKQEWEEAATNFFMETLQTAKALRPHAKVGFYALPWRSYTEYNGPAAATYRAVNDKAAALFQASDVIYPSIYMFYKTGDEVTPEQNEAYISSNVIEAQRLARLNGNKEVLPYVTYRYHPSNKKLNSQFLTAEDLWLQIGYVRKLGARGEMFWGWAPTDADRDELRAYFFNTIAPIVKYSCLEQQ